MPITKLRGLLFCIGLFLLAPLSVAEGPADQVTPMFWAERHTESAEKIEEALRSPLTDRQLEFEDTPLEQVVEFLRREYDIAIVLDLPALDDLAIAAEDPIDVHLRNISLGAALRIMLRQLDLTHIVSDEVLLITSEEEAYSRLQVAVYPVGDLLEFTPASPAAASDESEAPDDMAEDASGDDDDRGEPRDYNAAEPGNIEALIDVITASVASDTWVENGGPEAEIRPIQPGLLVVSQTTDVHEQIAQLLRALREAKTHEFARPFSFIDPPAALGGTFCGGHEPKSEPTPAADAQSAEPESQPTDQGGGGYF